MLSREISRHWQSSGKDLLSTGCLWPQQTHQAVEVLARLGGALVMAVRSAATEEAARYEVRLSDGLDISTLKRIWKKLLDALGRSLSVDAFSTR